ncbi:hypothetical protein KHQ81_15810 (plasmid) [Mycoplasmatota bacterium]|nr:hypothetical protein KHQ81_15810 [Mycoplasmatota bacterium]
MIKNTLINRLYLKDYEKNILHEMSRFSFEKIKMNMNLISNEFIELINDNPGINIKGNILEYNDSWLLYFLNNNSFTKIITYLNRKENRVVEQLTDINELINIKALYDSTITLHIAEIHELGFINQSKLKKYAENLSKKTKTIEVLRAIDIDDLSYEQYVFTDNKPVNNIENKIFINVNEGIRFYKDISAYLYYVLERGVEFAR